MPIPEAKQKTFAGNPDAWTLAATVAVVSGLFVLIVSVLLIANYLQMQSVAPLDNPGLIALRKQLNTSPDADPKLVEDIRAMDLLARKAFFTNQAQLAMGAKLLLAGVVVFVISFKLAARWRPVLPRIEYVATNYWEMAAQAKSYLITGGMVLAVFALGAAWLTPVGIPATEAPPAAPAPGEAPTAPVADAEPTWDDLQLQWPAFRGPGNYGVAHFTTAPTQWDVAAGQNIRWKTEVPLPGNNSPVVWGNRVFLCGATQDAREVYAFDTETGALLWKKALEKFPGTPDKSAKIEDETGYAPPTMAALGKRVFAMFPNGDLACFDADGNPQWGKNLGVPDNHYGHASSLIALGSLVYVQFDDRATPRLTAFDAATGKEAWVAKRTKISWGSPSCIPTPAGLQLVLVSEKDVDAYEPKTGAALWKVTCLDGEVAPSPAYADGIVFVANEYAKASAIQVSKDGTAVKTEVKWIYEDILPDVSSPVASAAHFYIATSRGEVVCLDRQTGKSLWTHEYDEGFSASMVLVGDRIYLPDKKGIVHIFKDAAQFESIGDVDMGAPVYATPAFLDNRIYLRTDKMLVSIGTK